MNIGNRSAKSKVLVATSLVAATATVSPSAGGQVPSTQLRDGSTSKRTTFVPATETELSSKEQVDEAVVEYLVSKFSMSKLQATTVASRQSTSEALLDGMAERVGSSWAGAYIDNSTGTLYLRSSSANGVRLLEMLVDEPWVVVERTTLSLRDLHELQAEISELVVSELQNAVANTGSDDDKELVEGLGYFSAIDIASNSVRLKLSDDKFSTQARSRIETRKNLEIEIVSGSLAEVDTSCPVSSCIPLGAGSDVISDNGNGGGCTTGFTVRHDGERMATTAGHCGPTPWAHGGLSIGSTHDTFDEANYDVKTITINDKPLWKATNLVYRPSTVANPNLRITQEIVNPDNTLQNITICTVGRGKRNNGHPPESCGVVTSVDGETKNWDNMGVANFRACRGDSGGPVYNVNTGRAYGWMRGFNPSSPNNGNCALGGANGQEVLFTWANRGSSALNADILLWE